MNQDSILQKRGTIFISRAGADKNMALLVRDILQRDGYTTFLQDDNFGHTSFMKRMREAFALIDSGARMVSLLSNAYMKSPYCMAEVDYVLTGDPANAKQRLIVFRIENCLPDGFLKSIPYHDLVPALGNAPVLDQLVVIGCRSNPERVAPDPVALRRKHQIQTISSRIRDVPGFLARHDLTERLETALWSTRVERVAITDRAITAMSGLGGVGKSVLAQDYAWTKKDRYHAVWWLRGEGLSTLLSDLVELGSVVIGKHVHDLTDRMQAARMVLDFISQIRTERPWLLVYDNVTSPEAIELLLPTSNCHVIITSRHSNWHGRAASLPVDVFSSEQALEFLLQLANGATERPKETREEADRLADSLGYLPLALEIARGHAWHSQWTYGQYITHLPALMRRPSSDAPKHLEIVFVTFQLALAGIEHRVAAAEQVLKVLAFVDPDRIPIRLFVGEGSDDLEMRNAIGALDAASLLKSVTRSDGAAEISVHRLVQQVAREILLERHGADAIAFAATRAHENLVRLPSGEWSCDEALAPHAAAIIRYASHQTLEVSGKIAATIPRLIDIAQAAGRHFAAAGEYSDAEQCYSSRTEWVRRVGEKSALAAAVHDVGVMYRLWGKVELAEQHLNDALQLRKKQSDDRGLGATLNNIGLVFYARQAFDIALTWYDQALEAFSRSGDDEGIARVNNNCGLVYSAQLKFTQAESSFRNAIRAWERVEGQSGLRVAQSLSNLAEAYKSQKLYREAEALYLRAIDIGSSSLDPAHPDIAAYRHNLGELYLDTGRTVQAEVLLVEAHDAWRTRLWPHHPFVAESAFCLAKLYLVKGDIGAAKTSLLNSIEILVRVAGSEHPTVLARRRLLHSWEKTRVWHGWIHRLLSKLSMR